MPYRTLNDVSATIPLRYPFDSYNRYILTPNEIREIEVQVEEKIPRDVKNILASFDLSSLEFGELAFGVPGRVPYLLQLNREEYSPFPWWGKGLKHPKGVLAVALDEEGVVILDVSDSKILYFHGSSGRLFPISQNLEEFILLCANFLWTKERTEDETDALDRPKLGANFWRMYGVETDQT